MIKTYTIHNFKNHSDSVLSLSNLNIFTGTNGMGKSSILQSMLLLRDSYQKKPSMEILYLDGDSVEIGTSANLVNCNIKEEQNILRIVVESEEGKHIFEYVYPIANVFELKRKESQMLDIEDLEKNALFNDNFQYLSAFRIGPKSIYNSNTNIVDNHRQLSSKMGMGEYTTYFLSKYGNDDIPIKALQYEGSESQRLSVQTEKWMNEISNGIHLKIDQKGQQYELKFGYEYKGKTTQYHSAINTGFGISYILSVVVAILSSQPNSLIIIENPEAHIHPSGQAALMRLITLAAANGVQVILETHSDHIVNGALVNLKNNMLNKDLLSVFFFHRDEYLNSIPEKLSIATNYRIAKAPNGFFDQMSIDLEVLFDL